MKIIGLFFYIKVKITDWGGGLAKFSLEDLEQFERSATTTSATKPEPDQSSSRQFSDQSGNPTTVAVLLGIHFCVLIFAM